MPVSKPTVGSLRWTLVVSLFFSVVSFSKLLDDWDSIAEIRESTMSSRAVMQAAGIDVRHFDSVFQLQEPLS